MTNLTENIVQSRKQWTMWIGITPYYIRFFCFLWQFLKHVYKFGVCVCQYRVLQDNRRIPRELLGKIKPVTFEKSRRYQLDIVKLEMFASVYWIAIDMWTLFYFSIVKMWFVSGPVLDWLGFWPVDWDYEYGETIVFISCNIIFSNVLQAPIELWKIFAIEQKYGFNNMTLMQYIVELFELIIIECAWTAITALVILQLIRISGQVMFVFLSWLFCTIWILTALAIYPNMIAPIFDNYTPLRDGRLRDGISNLARRINFPLEDILVLHRRWKSEHRDAYFYGIGNSRRIVIYDTLLDGYPEADIADNPDRRQRPEVLQGESLVSIPSRVLEQLPDIAAISRVTLDFTVGYTEYEIEAIVVKLLGNWVLGHTVKGLLFAELNLFIFFIMFSAIYQNSSLFAAFAVAKDADKPIILGLALLYWDVLDIYKLSVAALLRRFSRDWEFEADAYATDLGYGEDLISALIKLNKENLRYPFFHKWYWQNTFSYPAVLDRINAIRERMRRTE